MSSTSITQRRRGGRRAKFTRKVKVEPQPESREFAAGSIEAKIAAIGRCVPREEWETIPRDYFARLDYYQFGLGVEPTRPNKP